MSSHANWPNAIPEGSIKRERPDAAEEDALLESSPRPRKVRRISESTGYVVTPRSSPTPSQSGDRPVTAPEVKIETKVKKGKGKMCKKDPDPEVYLSEASVHRRLDCIFPTEYPIDLDKEIRDVVVSRGFLSKKYGGDARSTIPTIAEKHIRVHHVRNWMYPNLMYNPYAPALPGHRGLFFQPRGVIPEIPWRNIRYRVITRVFETQWNYVGEYEFRRADALTTQEWNDQSHGVKSTWASNICNTGWGRHIQARVGLRNLLGQEPEWAEVVHAVEECTYFSSVTSEDVYRAFELGQEVMAVWTMQCVGYDADFQRQLARGRRARRA